MSKSFAYYVTSYFGEYLPRHRGMSDNTIRSYRDTFVQLIEYLERMHRIPSRRLTMDDFTAKRVLGFLDYLENERKISISTRNQRLAAIHSFFRYIQKNAPAYFSPCGDILSIEFKKRPEPVIEYLGIEELQFLFSLPDIYNRRELRDLAILTTLYETGARVQELVDLRFGDMSLSSCPTVILNGKGKKSRVVPIGNDTASILRKYIKKYDIVKSEQYLFSNAQQNCLTRVGVQYIINKYIERGRKMKPTMFSKKISCHSFRHSKSMHLLEAGVNLIYIRDFLGHSSVTTTEVYARANAELKRKTIEQHSAKLDIESKYTDGKKNELLDWLKTTF